jgi:hypothetical protein
MGSLILSGAHEQKYENVLRVALNFIALTMKKRMAFTAPFVRPCFVVCVGTSVNSKFLFYSIISVLQFAQVFLPSVTDAW